MKAIEQILQVAQEHIDKCVENLRKFLEKKNMPFSAKDEEIHRLELTIPLIRSIHKYLLPEDIFTSVTVDKYETYVTISGIVSRDSKEYPFQTRIIYAGGWNIQKEHTRYITHSKLPKNTDKSAVAALENKLKKLTKKQKLQENIDRCDTMIARHEKELQEFQRVSALSEEEKLKVFHDKYFWNTDPRIRDNPECRAEQLEIVNRKTKWGIRCCKQSINSERKYKDKYLKKLAELD